MQRKEKLLEIIKNVDADRRELVDRLIDEMIFLEEQMTDLKQYPFISVHPDNKAATKQTAAAIQYKRWHESYANDVRILLSLVKTVDSSAEDDLMELLDKY